jgi:hypothetical protein
LPVKGYTNLTVREEVVKSIEEALPEVRSKADFVTVAVREKIERMKKEREKQRN